MRAAVGLSLRLILLSVVFVCHFSHVSSQLDLPSLPGPPYPDPRGQNRWGVKFDPRKHGPPYDKREGPTGSSHRNIYRRPPHRHRMRDHNGDRDSYWSPARLRPFSRRNRNRRRPRAKQTKSQRQARYYGNDLKKKRPRTHLKAYKTKTRQQESRLPTKAEEQQFWKSWNLWYRKQEKAKKSTKGLTGWTKELSGNKEEDSTPPVMFEIDINDLKKEEEEDDDDDDGWGQMVTVEKGERNLGGRWKQRRDYYLRRMKDVMGKAKSLVYDDTETKDKGKSEGGSWRMFTTIGKGLDAASGAMSNVRKTVGGSVLATGMKFGGKMLVDSAMNVGTSALTKAIKTATFL